MNVKNFEKIFQIFLNGPIIHPKIDSPGDFEITQFYCLPLFRNLHDAQSKSLTIFAGQLANLVKYASVLAKIMKSFKKTITTIN